MIWCTSKFKLREKSLLTGFVGNQALFNYCSQITCRSSGYKFHYLPVFAQQIVCLVPEIEITRSGHGAGVHGAVGCDVRGKKVVFKKIKNHSSDFFYSDFVENSDFETPNKLQK